MPWFQSAADDLERRASAELTQKGQWWRNANIVGAFSTSVDRFLKESRTFRG